jgi:hypothetical protein
MQTLFGSALHQPSTIGEVFCRKKIPLYLLESRRLVMCNSEQLFDLSELVIKGNRRGYRVIRHGSNPAQFRRALFEDENYIPYVGFGFDLKRGCLIEHALDILNAIC